MEQRHCYALLAAVSSYEDLGIMNLPGSTWDLQMMRSALTEGLRFPQEQIRVIGEDGKLTVREFARALQEFSSMLTAEDLLLVYYSGHGNGEKIAFTDGSLRLTGLADYLQAAAVKNRLLILDCCESGSLQIPDHGGMRPDERIGELAEKGMAVLSSTAPGEKAWMGAGDVGSLFTKAICLAMLSRAGLKRGKRTLFSVMEYARSLMKAWNKMYPEYAQHPVFRADLIGTVVFEAAEYRPYQKARIQLETERYCLYDVRSISTKAMRRFTAFFISKEELTKERIAAFTFEAAKTLKDCDVANSEKEAAYFRTIPARAVWCYFGQDLQDMQENCYAGYGLWTADPAAREQLIHAGSSGSIEDGIFVWMNPAYSSIRRMRAGLPDRETYIRDLRSFLSILVSGAERFISGLHMWENGETDLPSLRRSMKDWYIEVHRTYVRMSDLPVPDEDLREWSDAVYDLADWALDLALPLAEDSSYEEPATLWLLQHAAERYYEAINRVLQAEEKCRISGDL